MALQLLPLEEEDFPAFLRIQHEAFAGEFSNRVYCNGYGEPQVNHHLKVLRFRLWHTKGRIRFNKVIDPSLPDHDPNRKIISVAEWSFNATERSDEDRTEEKKALDDLGDMPGIDQALSDAVSGQIKRRREEVWGGKPHVLLHLLVTLPGHERRGAGARQLQWGVTAADELGLPAWIEASIPGRPLYERFGYREVEKLQFDAKSWGIAEEFRIVNMLRPAKDPMKPLPIQIKVDLPSVLVLGAGELGVAMLKALAKYPDVRDGRTKVAVLLRSGSKSVSTVRQISPAFSVLSEDLSTASVDTLADMFKLFDGIISCTGFAGGPGTQRKITKAVMLAGRASKADRIRYIPWQFGVDYDVFGRGGRMELWDEQLDVRDMLRSSAWPARATWTIVSTGIFTSFIFEEAFGVVHGLKENGPVRVEAIGGKDNKVTSTDVDDIGRITVEVLFDSTTSDQVVYTAGQTVSYGELASEIASVVQPRQVELVEKSVADLEEELSRDADNAYKKYRVVFAEGRGVSWDMSCTWNARRGVKTSDIHDWLVKGLPSQ